MYHDHDYVISNTGLLKKWKIHREKKKAKLKVVTNEDLMKYQISNINDDLTDSKQSPNERPSSVPTATPSPTEKQTYRSLRHSQSSESINFCQNLQIHREIESTKENRKLDKGLEKLSSTKIMADNHQCVPSLSRTDDSFKIIENKFDEDCLAASACFQNTSNSHETRSSNNLNDAFKTPLSDVSSISITAPPKDHKQKQLSSKRWRSSTIQHKKKPSKLKWHHTYFEQQKFPKRNKGSSRHSPPFAPPLSEAYLEQETRDSALEETLKEEPPSRPWKHKPRHKDPCLTGDKELSDSMFSKSIASPLVESKPSPVTTENNIDNRLFTDLIDGFDGDITDCDSVFDEVNSIRNYPDEELVTHDPKQSNFPTDILLPCMGLEREDFNPEEKMETVEMQTASSYNQSSSLSSNHQSSPLLTDVDCDIFSNFFDDSALMNDFVNESTLESILGTIDIDDLPYGIDSPVTTTTDLNRVTQDSFPMVTQPSSHNYSHEVLESATLVQYPECYPEACTSPADSGFNSPETVASPISDVCSWKNDVENHDYQSYFKYTVVPLSEASSPKKAKFDYDSIQAHDQELQFLNMDDQNQSRLVQDRSSSESSLSRDYPEPIRSDSCASWSDSSQSSDSLNDSVTEPINKKESGKKRPVKANNRPSSRRHPDKGKNPLLWEFIRDILLNPDYCPSLMKWEDRSTGLFRFVQSEIVASMWGKQKENTNMTYEKLSRAMRYYYNRGILERVDGRRLVYKFGPNARGWRRKSSDGKIQIDKPVPSSLSSASKKSDSSTKAWLKNKANNQLHKSKTPSVCTKEVSPADDMLSESQLQLPSASVLLDRKSRIATV